MRKKDIAYSPYIPVLPSREGKPSHAKRGITGPGGSNGTTMSEYTGVGEVPHSPRFAANGVIVDLLANAGSINIIDTTVKSQGQGTTTERELGDEEKSKEAKGATKKGKNKTSNRRRPTDPGYHRPGPKHIFGVAPKDLEKVDEKEGTTEEVPPDYSSLISMWFHAHIQGLLTGNVKSHPRFGGLPLRSINLMDIADEAPEKFRIYSELVPQVAEEVKEALREKRAGRKEAYFAEVPLQATENQDKSARYIRREIRAGRMKSGTLFRYMANPTDFIHELDAVEQLTEAQIDHLRNLGTWTHDPRRGKIDRSTTRLDITKLAWDDTPANKDMDALVEALRPVSRKFLFNFRNLRRLKVPFNGRAISGLDAMKMLLEKVADGVVQLSMYDIKGNMNGHTRTEAPYFPGDSPHGEAPAVHEEIPVFTKKDIRPKHIKDAIAATLPAAQLAAKLLSPEQFRRAISLVKVGIAEINFRVVPDNPRFEGRPNIKELLVPTATPVVLYHVSGVSLLRNLDGRNDQLMDYFKNKDAEMKKRKKSRPKVRHKRRGRLRREGRHVVIVDRSGERILVERVGGRNRPLHIVGDRQEEQEPLVTVDSQI